MNFYDRHGISFKKAFTRPSRMIGKVPRGHWKITTFVAALRHDAITAPLRHRRTDDRRDFPRLGIAAGHLLHGSGSGGLCEGE